MIAHFPLGIRAFQLKKASEGLSFLSLVFFYVSLILATVMKKKKSAFLLFELSLLSLPFCQSWNYHLPYASFIWKQALPCHLPWWNPRSEVNLASFMPKQKHLGKAGKYRTVPGEIPVMGKVVFAVTVPLITGSLTASSLDHPEPSGWWKGVLLQPALSLSSILRVWQPLAHPHQRQMNFRALGRGLPMCPQCQVYIYLIL